MPQYSSRHAALRALADYYTGSLLTTPREGSSISPAEDHLLGALCALIDERKEFEQSGFSQKFEPSREKVYRHMKSIAKCLGHWPISEEMRSAYRIRPRMGHGVGVLHDNHDGVHYFPRDPKGKKRWRIITGPLPERK